MYYQSTGSDNRGTVFFTGYYTPQFAASRVPNSVYRYPLYRGPPTSPTGLQPIVPGSTEGYDGLQAANGPLRGMELVWLSDRLEAFWVHIQGSAQLQLTDGSIMSVGYGGATNYPYTSIGRLLANDGKLKLDGQTIPVLTDFFRRNPGELNNYLPQNNRFIFFAETKSGGPMGSLQVPVTAERLIATDKSLMPPGALALVHTKLPYHNPVGQIEQRLVSRYVLDQDAGSAIKGPGRADYFVGSR